MAKLLGHLVLLTAVSGAVLFINLGVPRLWDRDEPRNAGCAVEMMERADWVVPVFNGELRTHKPVLLYWLMMFAYQVWGISEFAARFPSALAGCGTVLATYAIGRRLFGAGPALWAALILATSLMFDVAARAATPDSLLIFCSTLAMVFYVHGTFPREDRIEDCGVDFFPRSWLAAAGMYAAMGLGVLA
jgi:4-amino-4-deoxy-L-arabinose transferase-like glycosyltransferase